MVGLGFAKMGALAKIPLLDLRGYTPLELLFLQRRQAQLLAEGALYSLGAARIFAGVADRASRRWLQKSANPYLTEISLIADSVRTPGTYLLNTSLEWGCTAGAWASAQGPILRRVLDWPFPRLGEFVVVAHFSGKLGDFFSVTWPGYSGILQGMAPGRFAAAINQAPMRNAGLGVRGDWLKGRFKANGTLALPPSHLLRQAFETARDYLAAKTMLSMTPVAVPAIFTLSGCRPGEGCVIERTEDSYAVREMGASRVCATNQFEGQLNDIIQGWRPRPIDSAGRYAQALTLKSGEADFSWFTPPIANVNSRLVMSANAASGALKVMGTDGTTAVTEIFDLVA